MRPGPVPSRRPGAEPTARCAAAGCDRGHRVHGPVDLAGGVVQVEAEAAAGGRIQAERVVGQRGTVAAGPRLDPGLVQGLGDAERVPAGQVERDQRGAPGRVTRPVDRDSVDGTEPVERPAGQHLVPRGDAAHGGPYGIAPDRPVRAEVRRALRGQRQVEQQPDRLRGDDRAEDVRGTRGVLPRQGVVLDVVGEDPALGDHVTAVQERQRRIQQRLPGVQHPHPERGQQLVEGERQVVRAEGVNIGKRPRDQLRPVDQEPRAPFPVRLEIAARVGQGPDGGQRSPGPQKVGRARAADQFGARVDQ